MSPDLRGRLQTILLYALFIIVYVAVAGLLGSLVGLIVGIARQSENDILTGFIVGGTLGLLLGIVIAWLGRHGAPPADQPEVTVADTSPPPTDDQPSPPDA